MSEIKEYLVKGYYPTIGIECHVQLKTKTKLFGVVSNESRGAEPNTLVDQVCFGMPGALPVLNEEAVRLASKAAFALNTTPQPFSKFDRKHYFYPDLPKGYQISQFEQPIVLGGHVNIQLADGTKKTINITRAHMEEDAGKSTHPVGQDYSLVDLNRAGTPLLEIVSEPEIHTSEEAKAFAKELWLQMKYADVSDVDLYHGNMRFDVNVSVSKDPAVLGTRSETKNLNSFRSVERAVDFEIARQIALLDKGGEVVQETRGWLDAEQKTVSQRSKADAHDYRYFPDADIPPIVLDQTYIDAIADDMPILPGQMRTELADLGVDEKTVEDIVNVPVTAYKVLQVKEAAGSGAAKKIAFLFMSAQKKLDERLRDGNEDSPVEGDGRVMETKDFVAIAKMLEEGALSSTAGKEVFWHMLTEGGEPEAIAAQKGLIQVSDQGEIERIVAEVLAANPKAAEDVNNGEMKVIGFLVGQVMKQSKGTANPALAKDIITKQLEGDS